MCMLATKYDFVISVSVHVYVSNKVRFFNSSRDPPYALLQLTSQRESVLVDKIQNTLVTHYFIIVYKMHYLI